MEHRCFSNHFLFLTTKSQGAPDCNFVYCIIFLGLQYRPIQWRIDSENPVIRTPLSTSCLIFCPFNMPWSTMLIGTREARNSMENEWLSYLYLSRPLSYLLCTSRGCDLWLYNNTLLCLLFQLMRREQQANRKALWELQCCLLCTPFVPQM